MRHAAPALAAAAALTSLMAWAAPAGPVDEAERPPGGDTTVYATGRNAFSFSLANLDEAGRTRFAIGNSFFRRNWVEAPASTTARDGLGPLFIARSCGGCHVQDGRGAPPEALPGGGHEAAVSLLLRLSVPGLGPHGGVRPEPTYGDQLQNAALPGLKPEGQVQITHRPVHGRFADGTPYTLRSPHYRITDLAYGALRRDVRISPRIAPHLAGVGLLEAIADSDILLNAAAQAAAPGPIKGRPNWVWDAFSGTDGTAESGAVRLGRYGWKANVATLAHQTAGAFQGDIGISSARFPAQPCTAVQRGCRAAASGGEPEIDARTLADVVFYQATLAPAARREPDHPQVRRGEQLFEQAQCGSCHRPSYVTRSGPFPDMTSPLLNGQRIWPYTDLLLHDMGEALADHRSDFAANGRQWKTPPLWGIGLIRDVNGHQRLLHDGRARGVLEAVLWHGGEAEAARQRVLHLSAPEREALVRFVESL